MISSRSAPRIRREALPRPAEGDADATSGAVVTSTPLASGAEVRNRLFPKTRSWFALDAPLELLSPLSVLRILYGIGIVGCLLAAAALHPRIDVGGIESAAISGAVVWIALAKVRRVGPSWTYAVFLLATAQVALLVWAGRGTGLSYVYALFVMPTGVGAALFLSWRRLLVLHGFVVGGLLAALAPWVGVLRSATVAVVAGVAALSCAATVWFLTRTAKRHGTLDPDTGLPNGAGLARRLGGAEQQPSFVVAVTRLEGVDHARQALGHEIGTELLRRAVEDLGQVLPAGTFIGRVNGDELVVTAALAPSARPVSRRSDREAEALALARTLAGAVSAGRYIVGDIEVSLRTHVGLAVAPWDGSDVPELVRRASLSASRAAARGFSHLLWDGDSGEMTAADLALLADLRLAADRGELALAYQPQFAAASGRVAAVEALLRWRSPTHGDVSPSRFIPLAERTGFIDRLTEWVLAEALDAQVRWRTAGIALPVSINLSPASLTTPALPSRILAEVARRRLPTGCLTVEVTETAAIDLLQAVGLLRPLHDRGVRISIDDFGAGYTSLAALPDLPLDELKVDQRFVLRSLTSAADDAIVQTVRGLADRLGLACVAEGVETEAHHTRMSSYGFDLQQGFHLSRPLAEDDLLALVRAAADDDVPVGVAAHR